MTPFLKANELYPTSAMFTHLLTFFAFTEKAILGHKIN